MSIISKLKALNHIARGFVVKLLIDSYIIKPKPVKERRLVKGGRIVISLTSYGRRVTAGVLYYTLVSLLRQTFPPDKIVVWLDEDPGKNDILSSKLKKLEKYGVSYKYYSKNIRSYKKLIPALEAYPNDIIITVDDDVIYRKDIVESLIKAHEKNKSAIITRQCRFPVIIDNKIEPYKQWIAPTKTPEEVRAIMPIGVSGVLYPPSSFDNEVFNQKVFTELCPSADDIWFWIMAKRNGIEHVVIAQERSVGDAFDDLYQYFHKGSALTHSNSKKNFNDIQLESLLSYYKMDVKSLTIN